MPGEPRPVRASLRAGDGFIGVLIGHLPATSSWERADQNLLEVYASVVSVSIRNVQLFGQVESQNAQLQELNTSKDDFLRGVSHNLQTPLTSIRAYAEQLEGQAPDRRLEIIIEQTDRVSRMVRQLLTVSRLETGAMRPRMEVLALAGHIRRTWESMAVEDVAFSLDDRSNGWLAVADPDQLDQVLWALLDNAVKYGQHSAVEVEVATQEGAPGHARLRITVTDHGPGVALGDRDRLFARFARGTDRHDEGSGLGLYVSRALCRAMEGDLLLEPETAGIGARLSMLLQAEPPLE